MLVTGAFRAAIYCLSTGDIYSIDKIGRETIEQLEQGLPVSTVGNDSPDRNAFTDFLDELEALKLGNFSSSSSLQRKVTPPPSSHRLQKVWLEIISKCNLRCIHCYADSSPQKGSSTLPLEKWKRTISEAAGLGAKWIQLIGGEPLIYGKKNIFDLVLKAEAKRYDFIEIFTSGTLIDDEYARFFNEHKVNIALSVYSSKPEVHDEVTQCPGSLECTIRGAKILRDHNVPFRIGLTVMKQNFQYVEETLTWFKQTFGDIMVSTDIIRCVSGGRCCQRELLTKDLWQKRLRISPSFPKISHEQFFHNKSGHSCFQGQICIQSDGKVYPCIMDRIHVMGDVTVSPLQEVIAGEATRSFWGLSKDHIPICHDCEYRYACFDCPPLAAGAAGAKSQVFIKDPLCLYDPYKGEWTDTHKFLVDRPEMREIFSEISENIKK